MKKIDIKTVEHIAKLARISLSQEEKEKIASDLNEILIHMEKIKEIDTKDIPATFQTLPRVNVLREDQVNSQEDSEKMLQNAPQKEKGYFKVPKIL